MSRLVMWSTQPHKMSTGGFPWGVKAAECRTSHPTSSYCRGCVYEAPYIHIPHGPVMGTPLLLQLQSQNRSQDAEN